MALRQKLCHRRLIDAVVRVGPNERRLPPIRTRCNDVIVTDASQHREVVSPTILEQHGRLTSSIYCLTADPAVATCTSRPEAQDSTWSFIPAVEFILCHDYFESILWAGTIAKVNGPATKLGDTVSIENCMRCDLCLPELTR